MTPAAEDAQNTISNAMRKGPVARVFEAERVDEATLVSGSRDRTAVDGAVHERLPRWVPRRCRPCSPARITAWLIRHPRSSRCLLIVLVSVVVGAISTQFGRWQTFSTWRAPRWCPGCSGSASWSSSPPAASTCRSPPSPLCRCIRSRRPRRPTSLPMPVILLLSAIGGMLLGVGDGLLVHYLRAPAMIVTIGTQYVIRGFLLTFVGTELFINIPLSMERFGKVESLARPDRSRLHRVVLARLCARAGRSRGRHLINPQSNLDGTRDLRRRRQSRNRGTPWIRPAQGPHLHLRLCGPGRGWAGRNSARVEQSTSQSLRSVRRVADMQALGGEHVPAKLGEDGKSRVG